MRRRGRVSASPPAGFPLYGLDGSWPGARWLEGFGDAIGEEVRWVRLGHQDVAAGAFLLVETCSRALTDAKAAGAGVDPLRTVAFDAGALLANLTLPADSVPRPRDIPRALVDHVDQRSRQYAEWPRVTWRAPVPETWRSPGCGTAAGTASSWTSRCAPGLLGVAGDAPAPRRRPDWHPDQLRLVGTY